MKEKRFGMIEKTLGILISLALVGICSAADPQKEAGKNINISIAAGPAGGSYYPLSVGMSEIIRKHIPGSRVDVVNTGGSTENSTMVGSGESDIGITNGDAAYEAYTGTVRYAGKKLPNIRVLYAGIAGGPLHTVVAK